MTVSYTHLKDENFVIIAIYDIKSNLVEFYFDISKDIKYKPKVPVIKDLYLDVVITKNNYVEFIDEPELEEAYKMACLLYTSKWRKTWINK